MAEKLLCEEGGCVNYAKGKAQECLNMGLEASKAGHFNAALEKLQEGRDLLKNGDHLELWLQLSNRLAETYCQTASWQDCVSLCQLTLTTWGHSPHHFQLLCALFHLTCAYYWLDLKDQGYAAVEEWSGKLVADSAPSKCVLLYTKANKLMLQDRYEAAEKLLEEALQWDFSLSYITICSRLHLADVYRHLEKYETAEEAYLSALALFSAHFPKAYILALCYSHLASLYKNMKKLQDAEKHCELAKELFSVYFPHTEGYADCLGDLGEVYEAMNRLDAAEVLLVQASQLCSVSFPHSETHAYCLLRFGVLYKCMGREEEAVKKTPISVASLLDLLP